MKIGVYVCHCGVNIAATVDIDKVTAYARTLPRVAVVRNYPYVCSDPGQDFIKKDIKEAGIDRVVVAACSPRMHELTYRRALESAGLNPYFLEMANIREQCSWVHADQEQGTKKAMDLIASAVAKVCLHEPLEEREVGVTPAVLIIGGGIAGLQASLDVAQSGFEVYLVEKTASLGGHLAQLDRTLPDLEEAPSVLLAKIETVTKHPLIRVLTQSEVEEVEGFIGNYKVRIRRNPLYVDPRDATVVNSVNMCVPLESPMNEIWDSLRERLSPSPPLSPILFHTELTQRIACIS